MPTAKKKAEKPAAKSLGVGRVRRPGRSTAAKKPLKLTAFTAAEACDLFGVRAGKGGGPAFARWCSENKTDPTVPRTRAEWEPLLKQFADRPLHGHRRGAKGGNHRMNRR